MEVIKLETITLSAEQLRSFVDLQLEIWNNTDANSRMLKLKDFYTDNVSFFDHEAVVNGLEELNDRITKLQQKLVGFIFSPVKVDNSNNVVRYFWNFGPLSNPQLVSGMDLMIVEDGKVRTLHVFVDPATEKPKN